MDTNAAHLILVTVFALLHIGHQEDVNCLKGEITEDLRKCYEDQGLVMPLPEVDVNDSGVPNRRYFIQTVMNAGPDLLCNVNKEPFKRAMACVMNYTRHCFPTKVHGYIPAPDNMGKIVDRLCENGSDLNYPCVKSKAAELFDCAYLKGQHHFGNKDIPLSDYFCKGVQFNAECQRSVLPACGCGAATTYEKLSQLLNPPDCPPLRMAAPCNGGSRIGIWRVLQESLAVILLSGLFMRIFLV